MRFSFHCGFRKFFFFAIVAACAVTIPGLHSRLAAQTPIIRNIQSIPSTNTGISNQDMQNICAAAISTLFDQPTSSVTFESLEKGMMHLSMMPTDGARRQYRCKIEGKNVFLAAEDDPWQADDSGEQVTFQLSGGEILVVASFPDGSEKRGRFPRE